MSAEDLDNLFRDKLKNHPVAPSAEAWDRLQARMQQTDVEATANPFLVPGQAEEKEERKPIRMWYYSAAAAVTMLLSVGLWVNRDHLDMSQPSAPVAKVQAPANPPTDLAQTPAAQPQPALGQEAAAPTPESAQPERMAATTGKPQPQEAREGMNQPVRLVRKSPKAEAPPAPQATESSMMASNTPAKRAETVTAAAEPEPLEIIVKLDNSQATASAALASNTIADTPDEEERRSAGRVVKSIFKQVKNLKDGEKISREELGIPKHTFALETRIGNRRISKTIEL